MNTIQNQQRIIPVPNASGTFDAIHVSGPASFLAVRRQRHKAHGGPVSIILAPPFPTEAQARKALLAKGR